MPEYDLNIPSDTLYNNEEIEVFCAFCQASNKETEVIKDVGPFYGPFKKKKSKKNKD